MITHKERDALASIVNKLPDWIYTFEKYEAAYHLLLDKYAQLHVGDRCALAVTPIINEHVAPGWLGGKRFLVQGATGTVVNADVVKGNFYYDVVFDNETWLDRDGKDHPVQEEHKGTYHFREDSLCPLEQELTPVEGS